MSVKTWEFYPPYSCAVLILMVFEWSVFPLCTLRSQLRYWQKNSGSSMIFFIILMNFHDTWVHCWRWKIVIKIWVNMFKLLFIDQVIIFLVVLFILFDLIVLHVLFLCINKVSVLMIMVHMMNIVIEVIKSEWVYFWTRARNFCLSRTYVFGCILFY